MMGMKVTTQKADALDSLVRAIGGFREELLLWIDTELARLREGESTERLAAAENSTLHNSPRASARGGPELGPRHGRDLVNSGRPNLAPGMRHEKSLSRENVADRLPEVESTKSPRSIPEAEREPQSHVAPMNPRQRLDALARLLDHRLRQAQRTVEPARGPLPEDPME
jgi:hypothetical protein